MGFFESDIVQEEAKKLFTDYQELMKLGSDYGKFDREGKKMFIKKNGISYGSLQGFYEEI